MKDAIALRKEAVGRYLSGESKVSIGRALGKGHDWVSYWVGRYNPDDPDQSLQDRSSAPKHPRREWPEEVIEQVLNSRQLRVGAEQSGYEYALVGAQAIHYEPQRLGLVPTPPVRTIHYWLKQAGLVATAPARIETNKESKPYPAPACSEVNAVHQLDLKGPLYLTGSAQKHYLLALRDLRSKGVALDAAQNKQAQTITDFAVAAWQGRGLPQVLQMDNGLEFHGSNRYPRAFGKLIRVCLDVAVEPLFVPPHEPWRNGFIENFNGLLERLLLSREHFSDFDQLRAGAHELEQAVNTSHRLPALEGQTPDEFIAGKNLRLLAADYDGHKRDLKLLKGTVSFIRLVRKSGRITLFSNDKFDIDPDLKWQYVFARVDVQAQQLSVYHEDVLVKSFDFPL